MNQQSDRMGFICWYPRKHIIQTVKKIFLFYITTKKIENSINWKVHVDPAKLLPIV
jgi:hypothetical protein